MKIVTYNVNGLRSRVAQHGSLLKLLNSLDADIICFQETKLSRQDLSVDLTMAEGYEAFFSCTRTSKKGRSGYSGVATFCRVTSAFSSNEVALPLAAEEGFTGLLDCSRKREITSRDLLEMPFKLVDLEDIKNEDLLKVDSEGRCVISDHGHFVLFNLYGPRAEDDDEERLNFKLLFFKILQKRWESLLNQGRRVFIAGDLNIAPAAIDKCDAHPDFELNMFREWLRSLLRECGGPFFDVFRSKYPGRKEAYTCFPQNVGAEEFNYGSRIDHIFIAGPCFHENHDVEGHNLLDCHVAECDILAQFTRGRADNAPKWKGGRRIKLEGSDHVPVYAILNDVPNLPMHSTPSLSVRYIPEVRGWQQTIVSLLAKRQVPRDFERNELSNFVPAVNTTIENCHASGVSNQDFVPTSKLDKTPRKKGGHNTSFQLTLRSFFQQPESLMSADLEKSKANASFSQVDIRHDRNDLSHAPEAAAGESSMEVFEDENCKMNEGQCDMDLCSSSKRERDNVAILEWQRIQQKMKMTLPHCKGHGEPCVARSVKEGPNIGRRFYTCARAKGPASNPEANCDHFAWASVKFKKKKM